MATTKERETHYLSYYSIGLVLLYSYSTGKAEGAYYFDRGATDVWYEHATHLEPNYNGPFLSLPISPELVAEQLEKGTP